jgi:hypothetical protein
VAKKMNGAPGVDKSAGCVGDKPSAPIADDDRTPQMTWFARATKIKTIDTRIDRRDSDQGWGAARLSMDVKSDWKQLNLIHLDIDDCLTRIKQLVTPSDIKFSG